MSNPRILQAAMPAERMRGARIVTDFRDADSVARDGWTSVAAPTYHKDGGVVLNGTTQYLTRVLAGELNTAQLTIHLEFYPTFTPGDAVVRRLWDSTPGAAGRTLFYIDVAGTITITVANTGVLTAALAAYSAYWMAGNRNVVSISSATGANLMWLNGVQIATSTTARPTGDAALLSLGGSTTGTNLSAMRAGRLYFGAHLSTLGEHLAYWNRSMFDWHNRATMQLQMRTLDFDPTNVRTLDSSGHGNHATLGNGAGVGEPTPGKGYFTFDGVNDYFSGIANPAGTYTVLGLADTGTGWAFFSHNDLTRWTPIFTSGGFTGRLAYLMVVPEIMNPTALLDASRVFASGIGAKV